MKNSGYCYLLACFLSAPMTNAFAETLQHAWKAVLAADHGLKAVQENTAAAAQQLQAARAARLPGLEVGAGYTALNDAPAASTNVSGTPAEFLTGEKTSRSYQATATLPLYTSGRITRGIDAARASLEASHSDVVSHTLDLKLRVAEAFVGGLRAARGLEVANSHVTSLKAHARDVQNRYEQDMVARNDLLAAEVELADAEQAAIQAQNTLELARASYNRLLGRPLDQVVSLDALSPEVVDDTLPILVERALEQRSELAALLQQVQALQRQAAGTRAETRPQLALSGGYDYRENRFQAHEGQWSATLGLQWKVFDGGVIRHRAGATERQAAALQQQHYDLASTIKLQVRQAWLDVQETRKRIRVTEAAIDRAEENLKVNRDRYDGGLSTNTEVLDAETLRTRSQNNHANAVYDAVLAGLRLKRAVGEL